MLGTYEKMYFYIQEIMKESDVICLIRNRFAYPFFPLILAILLASTLVVPTLSAQTTGAEEASAREGSPEGEAAPAPADNSLETQILQLESNIAESERLLAETQLLEEASTGEIRTLPLESVLARTAVYRKILMAYQRHRNALRDTQDLLDRLQKFDAEHETALAISEEPPYTIAFLDKLLDEVAVKQMDVEAELLSLRALRELVSMENADIATSKTALNQSSEQLRSISNNEERTRLLYDVDTAKILVTANEAEHEAAKAEMKRSEQYLDLLNKNLSLAQARVEQARSQTLFRQDELDAIIERQNAAIKELEAEGQKARDNIEKQRTKTAQTERALERATEAAEQQQARDELALARSRMEAARIHLAIIESLQEYENRVIQLWQTRFNVANPMLAPERPDWKALELELGENLVMLNKDRTAGDGRSMSLRSQIITLETQLANWTEALGNKSVIEQQLAVLRDREVTRTRVQMRLAQVINLTERIIMDVRARQLEQNWMERIGDSVKRAYTVVSSTFDRELTEIGGESITGRKIFYLIIILVFGLVGGHVAIRFLRMLLQDRWKLESNVVLIFEKLSHYAWFIIVIYFALNYVNIPLTIFTFLGGAIALGIGFGAQNLINNFLSGLILMGEQPIRIGDWVDVDGQTGIITNIGARASRLKLFSGIDMIIPNSKFLENNVVNWTLTDKKLRLRVAVGAAYGSPTRDVAKLMMRAVTEHGMILKEPEPKVIFEEFGDNALQFAAFFWVDITPFSDARVVMSDVRHRIEKLFKEAGISIAFPQRDVHLDVLKPLGVKILKDKDEEEALETEVQEKPPLP
jgi:potassium-dependent mechanosensitive channel